jgi:PAS domain S-box-containing protein
MKLRVRLSLIMIGLVLVTGLLLAALISKQITENQRRDHDRWSASLASALAKAVFRDTLAGNRAEVIASLRRSMKGNPEIAYLMIVDFNGRIFAEVNKLKQPIPIKQIDHTHDLHNPKTEFHLGDVTVRDEVYPLIENLPAHLHVGFDTAYEARNLGSITQTILTTTAVLLLVTIVMALLFAERISRPIAQLATSLRNYGRGQPTPKREVQAVDTEVQELVDSFYAMTEENSRTLQALQGERNFIAAVLDHAGALVVVHDSDGRICRFNRICEQLSGYSAQEVVGKFPWEVEFLADGVAKFRTRILARLKREPQAATGRYSNYWVGKGGERYLIEWQNTVLCDSQGALEYLISLGTDITQKNAMENALRESEAQARAVFEQAAVGIAYVSPDGHWIDVNRRLCEILGYEHNYLLSTTFQNITHPDDLDKDLKYVTQMLNNEIQTYCIEKRYLRANGETIWTNLTVSLVRDENNEPQYFISVIEDINERKQTEVLLNNSERQLKEAQRIAHMGSWELDLNNNKLHWSDEIYRMFEIDPARFKASYEAFLNIIHPQDRDIAYKAYTGSLTDKQPYEITHRLLMADGRVKWVKERCETDFDADGKPVRSLGTVQDITEHVRIENELRDLNHSLERRVSERTYELAGERNFISTILDTASALVIVLDSSARIVRVNRACEILTGYNQDELQGNIPWELLVPASQRETMQGTFAELLRGAESAQYELEWICKSGERRLIAWSNSAITNKQGEVEYIIETGIDITERKAAEQALIQARDRAEQASHAKSEFMSRMSHELRTPLNAILGFSQLLESDTVSPLNETQLESVNEILHAGQHLLSLINEVLDLSRIESGHMQLSMEQVAVAPLLHTSVSLIQGMAEQYNIQVDVDANLNCAAVVMADPVRLKQVILNLLSNAIKYNKDGGSVQVSCNQDGAQHVHIAVTDTGDGISEEQLPLLFAPFERLDADNKAIPGTGIGLALSKRMMEMMGGTIGVESKQGEGSTFWLRLEMMAS